MRDISKKHAALLCKFNQIETVPPFELKFRFKQKGIDNVCTSFISNLVDQYSSTVSNMVRTISKLQTLAEPNWSNNRELADVRLCQLCGLRIPSTLQLENLLSSKLPERQPKNADQLATNVLVLCRACKYTLQGIAINMLPLCVIQSQVNCAESIRPLISTCKRINEHGQPEPHYQRRIKQQNPIQNGGNEHEH